MICNNCGTPMVDQFSIHTLEHKWVCPKCNYNSMTIGVNKTPESDFKLMNGIDFTKHALERQMYIDPEDCAKAIKFDYNPFKDLREEFEQSLLTYRDDKDNLIDILSSTVRLLLRILEVTHAYRG